MNIWHDIDEDRIYPTDFISVIEISKGSNMKYELDKKTGMLSLDRVLFTATYYPRNRKTEDYTVSELKTMIWRYYMSYWNSTLIRKTLC